VAVTRYSAQVNLEQLNSTHALAILSIAPGSRVLDLGAADGSVARGLKERGCQVWAVELDAASAQAARQVCDRVICGDLESDEIWRELEGERFDAVLALDVLEHLRQPEPVLARAGRHLTPAGFVVVSLPNVTHGAVRLSLLHGRFNYQETGPLDRTHLRFFDRAAAERLMTGAGFVITQRLRVSRGLEETEVPVSMEGLPPGLVEVIARDQDATTYQFVFVGVRGDQPLVSAPSATMLPERLLAELDALQSRFGEVEQYARDLAADRESFQATQTRQQEIEAQLTSAATALRREADELKAELDRRMGEAQQRHLELKYAKMDISVKEGFVQELRQELQNTRSAHRAGVSELESEIRRITGERDRLRVELAALRRYADSAGFRITEAVITGLKRIPFVFAAARWLARALAGRRGD
jgi:O-antigen biosynthesis protein